MAEISQSCSLNGALYSHLTEVAAIEYIVAPLKDCRSWNFEDHVNVIQRKSTMR